ncbi:hypothetical protein GCM10007352_32320 [Mucilaginibacter phyllosphaerae]|nr:hypothetical protein GCM10007352_32320 [Mucilaginibacter phyllosphaerae]
MRKKAPRGAKGKYTYTGDAGEEGALHFYDLENRVKNSALSEYHSVNYLIL